MKIKVTLHLRGVIDISAEPEQKKFPDCFDKIEVEQLEPPCPFCGKALCKGKCSCAEYANALKKLCLPYQRPYIIARVQGLMPLLHVLHDKEIEMSELVAEKVPINAFDSGTIASGGIVAFRYGNWYLSLGDYENKVITFLMRKKGEDKVYQCRIKNLEVSLIKDAAVELFYTTETPVSYARRLGGYRLEQKDIVVAAFPYLEYLQKLTM